MKKILLILTTTILILSCETLEKPKKECSNTVSVQYNSPYTTPYDSDFVDKLNHPFPRLAMWWPSSWHQDIDDLARYDWIGWSFWDNFDVIELIKEKNPDQIHFMSGTITETSWIFWEEEENKEIAGKIPGEFFLTSAGSNISENIDESQSIIKVDSTRNSKGEPLFEKGETLVCGYETMRVISVDYGSDTLEVERGFYRSSRSHSKGTRIASHVTFWPESWVMNLSEQCPKVEMDGEKLNWREWSVKYFLPTMYPNIMDGYLLDRLEDTQSWLVGGYTRSISPDFTNNEVDDYTEFDKLWKEGIRNALSEVRENLNVEYVIANSFGAHYDLLDGCIYEGMPTNWSDTRPLSYTEWATDDAPYMLNEKGYINVSKTTNPNFSFVETYEVSEWYDYDEVDKIAKRDPDEQHMRFGLSSALLGDGYFSYETSTQGHGTLRLYWFDEYDDGGNGKGYLGYPLGEHEVLTTLNNGEKIFVREFGNGVAFCNPTDSCIEISLDGNWRLPGGGAVTKIHLEPRDGRVLVRNNQGKNSPN